MTGKYIKHFFIGIGCLFSMFACDKETQDSSVLASHGPIILTKGSAYIQCEIGPFFISHARLDSCATNFGFDSLMTEVWEPGCSMSELMQDSLGSDFRLTYLNEGELVIEGTGQELDSNPFELVISSDTLDVGEYPFYGALKYELNGLTYSFVLLNRYIGGCFHDELIWEIRS
jgi:hypothetical protein